MNNKTPLLVQKITEAIQEKKGKKIVIVDLQDIKETICKYFVVCEGNSPSQIAAIVDSIKEYVREETGEKVLSVDGLRNAQWVVMDYADVLVHIFLPDLRDFYQLEHLWADAKLTELPDLD